MNLESELRIIILRKEILSHIDYMYVGTRHEGEGGVGGQEV